ncbi:caprin-1-like isoform X3 [Bacillus rossius redtenbacheri]|uniref:caprin-1-like isoform X3 n=1 Tax=Bacillus rossius redtenbacheri TaxID=93214 RepID=UPI002FDD5E07
MEINKETEITEPFPHAVAALEGKIKSLQQLKKSTESLKKAQRSGHSLDSEQRSLVARLEEVQCSLKNLLHVQRQFANIARDSASERRQRALRTELERTRQDITRIKEILLVQDVLENMRKEEVRKDFLCGQNGAVRLSEEALDNLDDFYVEISLVRGTADEFPAFQDQLQQSAEHLLALVDGREAEIIGTTYAKLKGVITAICMSGYFDYLAKETSLYSGAAQSRGAGEKGCGEDDAEMADRCIASSQAVARDNVKACNGFKRSPQEVVSSSTEEEIAKELPSSVAGRQNGSMLPQVRKSTRVKGRRSAARTQAVAALFDRWSWGVLYHPPHSTS